MMRYVIPLMTLILTACNQPPEQTELERYARSALNCPVGTLSWSVVESIGGTVDQSGNYRAPPCQAPYDDAVYHVHVDGCGRSTDIPIAVADSLKALTVYCGVVAPETCCRVPPLSVPPGANVQFYASLQYNCAGHVAFAPMPPPELCP
jgi:hypothetical protein